MNKTTLNIKQGSKLEFWLKTNNPQSTDEVLNISNADGSIYKVTNAANYYDFYSYSHDIDETLTLEVSPDAEVSLAYFYHPEDVDIQGVTYLEINQDEISFLTKREMEAWYQSESFRPQLHFSPFKAWMNDPNGCCKIGDTYHMFYQYYPNDTQWGPMHWGHAISKDLLHWTHLPIFNHPEQNLERLGATGGAFSGTTYVNPQGEASIYYTERRAAYDLYSGYVEVQKKAKIDAKGIKATNIEEVITTKPQGVGCDIRDPKVWFDYKTNCYRMILGSVHEGDPAVLQYTSEDGDEWEFCNVLYKAPSYFSKNDGRCIECPDFFELNGQWVLIFGIVGYHEPKTNRHNLLYALIGEFDNGVFYPGSKELQVLDFATEYYALQTFNDGKRQVGIAWMYNWATNKPIQSVYNGEMSIPRELFINENNKLAMWPISELQNIIDNQDEVSLSQDKEYILKNGQAFEVLISQGLKDNESLTFKDDQNQSFSIQYKSGKIHFIHPNDEEADYSQGLNKLDNLRIIFDSGVIEIFVNDGEVCGTKRSYLFSKCHSLSIQADNNKLIQVNNFKSVW